MKRLSPHAALLADYGFAAGMLILPLQLLVVFLPAGEGRDWAMYLLTGGWAVALVLAGFAKFQVAEVVKVAVAAYAAAVLNWYFVASLANMWLVWLWLLAGAAAWRLDRQRWPAVAWGLLCAFGMCGTLVYNSPWLALAQDANAARYAVAGMVLLLAVLPVVYRGLVLPLPAGEREVSLGFAQRNLRKSGEGFPVKSPTPALLPAGGGGRFIAYLLLTLAAFRTQGLAERWAVHHWKAFVEPAAAVRGGGWLLWDVPSVYGFAQTLLLAFLPAGNAWQSLYLVNGALLAVTGGMVFHMLRRRYPFMASLLVALSVTLMLLPSTPDPRIMPSTGAMRFFWGFALVGYVFHLCAYFHRAGRLPRHAIAYGNLLWLAGALWSLESAALAAILWLPSLVLIALAEIVPKQPSLRAMAGHVAMNVLGLAALALASGAIIWAVYALGLGHAPEMGLLGAYAEAFALHFATLPIAKLACAPCWLLMFYMLAMAARRYAMRMVFDARGLLAAAAVYCLLAALWGACAYYIPFSEDFHLTGTLPLLAYVSAAMLALLPMLELPALAVAVYEKTAVCLYSVLVLATLAHFGPGMAAGNVWTNDVGALLQPPPQALRALVAKAKIPGDARVQILSSPMVERDGVFYLERVEGFYFADAHWRPWLLPNTILGYAAPLSGETYERLALRRAARMDEASYWLIEEKDGSQLRYPWLREAIGRCYRRLHAWENEGFVVSEFMHVSSPACGGG